jgi:hypothetical protein
MDLRGVSWIDGPDCRNVIASDANDAANQAIQEVVKLEHLSRSPVMLGLLGVKPVLVVAREALMLTVILWM